MTFRFRSLVSLFQDLRRRRVIRAAVIYWFASAGFLSGLDSLVRDLVPWVDRAYPYLVLTAIFLFPVAMVLAWVFEVTSEGIRIHRPEAGEEPTLSHRIGALVAVGLIAVAFGWAVLQVWEGPSLESAEVPAREPLDAAHLAVLYFDDHSPGGELAYLANGLTEDLINALVNVDGLTVTSRNGVKPFREGTQPLTEIARQLGVGTLVEGSVTGSGGRIRATAQLIEGSTGDHLWSRQFEAELTDVLALQDELVGAIALALRKRLGEEIRLRETLASTTNPRAWTLYRSALEIIDDARELSTEDAGQAVMLMDRADSILVVAEELDPRWADPPIQRGWLAFAKSAALSESSGFMRVGDSTLVLAAAERAVRVSGGSEDALELRGAMRLEVSEAGGTDGPYRELAEEDLREAIRRNPNQAGALAYLSTARRVVGDFGGARLYAEQAMEADAFLERASSVVYRLFEANLELKAWGEAERWCAEGRRRFEKAVSFVLCRFQVMTIYPEARPPDAVWALLDSLESLTSRDDWEYSFRPWGEMQVAKALARSQLADSARAVVVSARGPEPQAWLAYDEAHVRLLLGDRAAAMDLLQLYVEEVAPQRREYLAEDWLFEDLWDDPRFVALTSEPPQD